MLQGWTVAAGYETLFIDVDSQGYLTNSVRLEAEYTAESTTLYNALHSPTEYYYSALAVPCPRFNAVPANINITAMRWSAFCRIL